MPVALRMCDRCIINLDSLGVAESGEFPCCELGSVVRNYGVQDAKAMDYLRDKLNCFGAVMDATGFASIHLVNLSTATKI